MVQRKEVFQILSRILEVSETRTGTQCKLRMVMSGWFIFLPLFFSGYNKDWKQHISYSSVIAQADRSFISLTLPKKFSSSFLYIPFGFPLLHFQSPNFGYACCKVGLALITSQ